MIRKNHLAVRLKSNSESVSGKQPTPVKKGQKRPIVFSSSSTSPKEIRPFKPPTQTTRITAKTVSIPIRSRLPTLWSASTPLRSNSSSRKSAQDIIPDAPGIRPIIRDTTPIVDLTACFSTSEIYFWMRLALKLRLLHRRNPQLWLARI